MVILNETSGQPQALTAGLRHGTGKNSHIVLVPQPSEDPNDPLNWSLSKKLAIILIIGYGSCLTASAMGPLLNSGLEIIAEEFGVSIGNITLISGYQLLVVGCSGPIVSACSRKWGKRPCFLISTAIGLVGTIVGSSASSYDGLLACRIIQGFSVSAYESLIISVVGDLYFVHERGPYMAGTQFCLSAVSNFSSVISGAIINGLGWKFLFHILNACLGLQIILLFLFCPETTYNRDRRYETDTLANSNLGELAGIEKRHQHFSGTEEKGTSAHLESDGSRPPPRKTFKQELAVFTGTYSDENIFRLVIAPFASGYVVVAGYLVSTYVAQSYVLSQIFSAPPYSLSALGVGYLSLGPFIGGLIGAIIVAIATDPIIKWAARHNNGVHEPEYRLLPMAGSILAGVGVMVFGVLCQKHKSYYATATAHGLALCGIVLGTIPPSMYALDAFREMSNEMFISSMVFKNFLFYGFSYFVNDWTARKGPEEVFLVFGGLSLGLVASTVIVFIWGKRYRSYWHRHNLLTKFHIQTHSEF
ncbi:hypothetical protein DPV78_009215 [Talaromyces pinophilus]|nr:hypothetical protein DPV78_009215 [Talaromyces pinophilus]